MRPSFPFDPISRSGEVEALVMQGSRRLYYRFRSLGHYGGVVTADAVGCNILCAYCWNQRRNLNPAQGDFHSPGEVVSRLRVLTTEERLAAKQLKRLLHIKEGDLWGLRRREVEELVGREVDRILGDEMVDQAEALYQAHLQEIFDLSYDQYLEVSRRFVDRIIDERIRKLAASGAGTRERMRQLFSLIARLDTVYKLRKSQKEELLAPPLPPAQQQSPLVG